MENCMLKLKRKGFDDSNDEIFADLCLSSPASKIRRLDAGLAPIIEQDAAGIPPRNDQPIRENAVSNEVIDVEELSFVPDDNEKAIVLFKPMNKPLFYSPNNFSIDPNLISSFKNHALLHSQQNAARFSEEGNEGEKNGEERELNACKAIIPWVPSEPVYQRSILASETEVPALMESEEMDATMMDIEDTSAINDNSQQEAGEYINHSRISEGLQQHCMIPQPPQNTATPIVWYR